MNHDFAKNKNNVPGRFFVLENCHDCGLCVHDLPQFFAGSDGFSFIHHQPTTADEIALVQQAALGCPAEAIQDEV
jgi:ferredoxin